PQYQPPTIRLKQTTSQHSKTFFFSSRRRHTRFKCDWSSDVCSSDLCRTPTFRADVGVLQGKVVEIGKASSAARAVLDAGGLALMPGIVDVHTHYDAQITW